MEKYRITYLSLVGVLKITLPALLLIMCFMGVLAGVVIGDIVNTPGSWIFTGLKYGTITALAMELLIIAGVVITNLVLRFCGGMEIELSSEQQQTADA